jgi:hypothetical protein
MLMSNETNKGHPIFRSMGDDGTCLLFVILPERRWAITRNEEEVVSGATTPAAINSGVQKYLSLTTLRKTPLHAALA